MPFFSIIVPVYKVEKYLDECVQSVLSQTFTDYECILVDDGSPDNCPVMCDEYAKKYEQIKVIHKENGGLSDARNVGILQASGEYIVLLDSDDKFTDNKALKNLFDIIEKYRVNVIANVSIIRFLDSGENYLNNSFDKNIIIAPPKIIVENFDKSNTTMAAWVFIVNREYLIKNNLFFKKGILHEDEHWMPRTLFRTELVAVNHSPFYAYRKGRSDSIMGANISSKRLFDLLIIINDLLDWSKHPEIYTKAGCDFIIKKAKDFWANVNFLSKCIKNNDKESYSAIRKKLKAFSKECMTSKMYLLSLFIGIDNAILLQKFYIKVKQGFKRKTNNKITKTKELEDAAIKNFIEKGLCENEISTLVKISIERVSEMKTQIKKEKMYCVS